MPRLLSLVSYAPSFLIYAQEQTVIYSSQAHRRWDTLPCGQETRHRRRGQPEELNGLQSAALPAPPASLSSLQKGREAAGAKFTTAGSTSSQSCLLFFGGKVNGMCLFCFDTGANSSVWENPPCARWRNLLRSSQRKLCLWSFSDKKGQTGRHSPLKSAGLIYLQKNLDH